MEGINPNIPEGFMPLTGDKEMTMISSDIQCAYCGLKGKIEGYAAEPDDRGESIFKHRGYNPFSGHLHYQCPSCSIVQLVLPMDILEGKVLNGFPGPAAQGDLLGRIASNAISRLTEFRKTIQTRLLPGNAGFIERRG
jgi:hypothetical protein